MSAALILGVAVLLDFLLREPPNKFHPVAWLGNFVLALWRRRPNGRHLALFCYGALITIGTIVVVMLPAIAIARLGDVVGVVAGIIVFFPSFSIKKLLSVAQEIQTELVAGRLDQARWLTGYHLVSRATDELEELELAAAVIESLAENLSDSFVAPVAFFTAGGLPAAWAYRATNTVDAMLGYRHDDYAWGGKFAARLDDLLSYIPARLTAALLVFAGRPQRGRAGLLLRALTRKRASGESPNAYLPMTVAAVLLGLRLEKHNHYALNLDGAPPTAQDIGRCIRLVQRAALLMAGAALLVLLMIGVLAHG